MQSFPPVLSLSLLMFTRSKTYITTIMTIAMEEEIRGFLTFINYRTLNVDHLRTAVDLDDTAFNSGLLVESL